jgi:hypothetical protein
MSSINNLSSIWLQSIFNAALPNAGATAGNSTNGANTSSAGLQADSGQLSTFAQLTSALQQLQQSNPTEYQQVTRQIAVNLQKAAQTAQSDGNTTAANQLNQLATDFTNASQSGQLPDVQDLAQAIGGGHHHHHAHASSSDADSSTGSSSTLSDSTTTSQTLSQLLSAFQSNGTQNASLSPAAIILNTLSGAGITLTNG